MQKSSQALNSFCVTQKASVQCSAYKNTSMRASHIKLSRREAANASVGRKLATSSDMNEQHTGSPTESQLMRSIGVHEPSSVLAFSEYSHAKLSIHPCITGTQLPSSVFAVSLKLNAVWFTQPYSTGMQLPFMWGYLRIVVECQWFHASGDFDVTGNRRQHTLLSKFRYVAGLACEHPALVSQSSSSIGMDCCRGRRRVGLRRVIDSSRSMHRTRTACNQHRRLPLVNS